MTKTTLALLFATLCLLIALPLAAQPRAIHHPGGLAFEAEAGSYEAITLSVSGPAGIRFTEQFGPGESPALGLEDAWGNTLPDGLYKYQLTVTPRVDAATAQRMNEARAAGDDTIVDVLRAEGQLPEEKSTYRSGTFRVEGGAVVSPEASEPRRATRAADPNGPIGVTDEQIVGVDSEVVLTNADGVIRNSLCTGFDCPNSPSFSDTTMLMMENNTRIKFDDTSSTSSFPRRDWEIEANSNVNGGASYLGINDCGESSQGGCATDLVFAIEANVRQSALYVESDGDVGIGTSNPALKIHIRDGDTPDIRLEQDSSSGFTPQTWDLAGNETNFFIRDATNGSKLPFRIRPNAPSSSIDIASDGDVGVGTSSPDTAMHIRRTTTAGAGSATLTIEDTGGTGTLDMIEMMNDGASGIAAIDTDASHEWRMVFRSTTMSIRDQSNALDVFTLDDAPGGVGGNLTIAGDLFTASCSPCISDYVFEPDYELMPLDQLASFIAENKHLPNVPGKADLPEGKSFGIQALQVKLLEKIEELTLYTLQQEYRIEAKDQEVQDLAERLARLEQQLAAQVR